MLFGIDISESGEWVVVSARGDIDLASAPRVASALAQLPPGARRVVVDLSHVDLLDATGIGLLVGLRSRLAQTGGRLVLSCPAHLRHQLERSGVTATFELAESVESVLAGCPVGEGPP